jgi:MoaA/NifB/PqqE/SkfB family radical SAM enzyme
MVKAAQVGITTKCNSSCAFCHRILLEQVYGFIDRNSDMKIDVMKKIVANKDLEEVQLCGNRGEAIFHPEFEKIISLIKQEGKRLTLNTNGDKFDSSWWYNFGKESGENDLVIFALDGLKTAHEKYRKTNFINVLSNMKAFIKGGGTANWQMILFKHNESQVNLIKKISKDIGCKETWIINSRMYNTNYEKPTKIFNKTKGDIFEKNPNPKQISCMFLNGGRVYIGTNGEVWPCCYTKCHFGFEAMWPDNKYITIAKKEKEFINAENTSLDQIVKESNLFKTITTEMNSLVPCRLYCGNKDSSFYKRNRRIILN